MNTPKRKTLVRCGAFHFLSGSEVGHAALRHASARSEAKGRPGSPGAFVVGHFRRLTLRSATERAQRARFHHGVARM